jgi:hypothetical protein
MVAASRLKTYAGGGGKIGQVIQQIYATATTIATDSGDGTATGLTLDITCAATSSKVLINVNISSYIDTAGRGFGIKIFRDSTEVYSTNATWIEVGGSDEQYTRSSWTFIDSPSSTSALTYSVNALSEGGNAIYLHYANNEAMITLWEILA